MKHISGEWIHATGHAAVPRSRRGGGLGITGEAVLIPVQSLLGYWEGYRFDFHWYYGSPTAKVAAILLQRFQENQHDARRLTWTGIIVGNDAARTRTGRLGKSAWEVAIMMSRVRSRSQRHHSH